MATVPDDSIATVQEEGYAGRAIPRFSIDASPADFGAGLGEGIERGGQEIGQAQRADNAANIAVGRGYLEQQKKAEADETRVRLAQTNTQISDLRNTILFGKSTTDANGNVIPDPNAVYTQSGPGIANLPERALSQFDEQVAKITAGLTPEQQSMISERVASERDSLHLNTLRYQSEQANREAQATFSTAVQSSIHDASINYRDPEATPRSREDIYNAGMALATRGGKDAVLAYQHGGYQQDLDKLHEGVVGSYLADGNVGGAQRYLNQWKGDLSSGVVTNELENRIRAAGDRIEAKQKDGARDAYQDSLKGAIAGVPNADKLVSDQQLQLLHPQTWQREREFLTNAAAAGAAEKQYDQMTPDAIQRDLQASEPTEARPGLANDLELQRFKQEAAQRSIKSRDSDPGLFAIKTGAYQPLDTRDPDAMMQNLRQRANIAPEISRQVGVQVPMLSKDEAKQFSQYLGGLSPDKRMGALQGLRQGLGSDQAYTALLRQVAPNSPLTALAGVTVDKPDFVNTPTWYDPKHGPDSRIGQQILSGEEILRDKDEKGIKSQFPMPPDEDTNNKAGLRTMFTRAIGGANSDLFAGRPETLRTYYAAYRAAYAAEASERGHTNGIADPEIARDVATRLIGGATVEYGHTTLVPPSGMDPTRFRGLVDKARDESLKAGGYSDDEIAALREHGLREIGNTLGTGRYVLVNGNGDALSKKGGGPAIVIDLNKQYANLKRGEINRWNDPAEGPEVPGSDDGAQ